MFKFNPVFQTLLPPKECSVLGTVMVRMLKSLSAVTFLSHVSSAPVLARLWLQFLWEHPSARVWASPWAPGDTCYSTMGYLLLLWPWCPLVPSHSFCSLPLSPSGTFCHLSNMFSQRYHILDTASGPFGPRQDQLCPAQGSSRSLSQGLPWSHHATKILHVQPTH